jgi:hypothetical protein
LMGQSGRVFHVAADTAVSAGIASVARNRDERRSASARRHAASPPPTPGLNRGRSRAGCGSRHIGWRPAEIA